MTYDCGLPRDAWPWPASSGHDALAHVHLQWFAAEDEGRTEEPTEQKLRKAREDGKVARSAELPSALVLLFGVVTLAALSGYIISNTLGMLRFFFTSSTTLDVASSTIVAPISLWYIARLALPVAFVGFAAALFGNLFQVGFLFTTKPITPDFSRIIPRFGRFFKRALFSAEAGFNLAKSLVKVVVIGLIAFLNIRAEIERLATMVEAPLLSAIVLIAIIAFRIATEAAIALVLLSIPDYAFQRRLHRESLKMSRQEVKEERRQYEGDPLVRSRLRERMRDLLTRNMLREVPRADVVITNPTHFAVAMRWDRILMPAPTVIAKGADLIAQNIRELAQDSGVPVIENKPLARALYHEVEIGDVIPDKFYEVMAAILAQIYTAAEAASAGGRAAAVSGGPAPAGGNDLAGLAGVITGSGAASSAGLGGNS